MIKTNKGITLIALVITIIVLLILAGVTIQTLTGDNGLITKSSNAKQANENASVEEKIKLAYLEYELEKRINPNVDIEDFTKNSLEKAFNESITTEKVGNSLKITFSDRNKKYKYLANGNIIQLLDPTPDIYAKLDDEGNLYLRATALDGYNIYTLSSSIQPNWNSNGNASITSVKKVIIEEPIAPQYTYFMFNGCSNLKSIENIENLHTENVKSMKYMFNTCSALSNLDLSNFDTYNVTDMSFMFTSCSLTNIDLSSFNTCNVNNLENMFLHCSQLKSLDLNMFDTGKVNNMRHMFNDCSSLTSLDLSGWNTEKVTSMYHMFWNCENLTTIYVGPEWTTENVFIEGMFNNCGTDSVTLK